MNGSKEFRPDPKMKPLYFTYLALVVVPLFMLGLGLSFLLLFVVDGTVAAIFAAAYFAPLVASTAFVSYWIPKYYGSIRYVLTESEVRVERGVWWKMHHIVPFSRIMSVDTVQGPLSRRFGLGTVDVYTAGYTGPAGGAGRRAEACIMFIPDFLEMKEKILNIVKGRPLFGAAVPLPENLGQQMLEELKEIRKLLSSKPSTA